MADAPEIDEPPQAKFLRQHMVPDHERLNIRLRTLLLDMAERIPDIGSNTPTGQSHFTNKWLSARDLHLRPDPEIKSLVSFIEDTTNSLPWPRREAAPLHIHSMWAIVSRHGMEGRPHQHSSRVSGAYYVDAGACDGTENGAFAIYSQDQRLIKVVPPKTGLMLLFPSGLWHGVLRYESDRPRIVLSFNLVYSESAARGST
jgi:hypothetical protein